MTRFGISKVFKKTALYAGLSSHHSIHTLRHTYATNLYKASGYNLRMVQKQLAQSASETTKIYTHPNFELAKQYVNKIPEIMGL